MGLLVRVQGAGLSECLATCEALVGSLAAVRADMVDQVVAFLEPLRAQVAGVGASIVVQAEVGLQLLFTLQG